MKKYIEPKSRIIDLSSESALMADSLGKGLESLTNEDQILTNRQHQDSFWSNWTDED